MAATKKTLQQQIDETEAKLKSLKERQADHRLERASPGMDQLLVALDVVVKENKCKVVDVIKSLSKMKKLGLQFTSPTRKKKGSA